MAHRRLKREVDRLFDDAARECTGLEKADRRHTALRALVSHREELCVFLEHPQTPMDNNASERSLRRPVIGRKLSFGSDSLKGGGGPRSRR